ncbi:MAG: sugar ABC transporter permease [Hungatella sp.]|jgi:raffinose/stachyose/melibiose transport system permease protein|nr:sugar ABC transporter permease [Hungatella sp.]
MRTYRKLDPFLFLALPLLTYMAVVLVPVVASIYYSFTNWNGISEITFVGFDNYVKMFKDPNLGMVLLNTLLYSATATIFQVGGGLFLAVLVSRVKKGSSLLRVLLFTPVVISSMAMAQTFKKLLSINPDGVVNALLEAIGLSQFKMAFLADMHITLFVLAIIESLRFAGLYMVVFYTALVAIDKEVLEASSIDGASGIQSLFRIQFPMISGIIINCLVLAVVGTLKAFDGPYIMTNGGPGYSTELLSIYMYKRAFNMMDYGYSSALAVLMVIICIAAYRLLDRMTREKM